MPINNGIINQKGTPAFYSDIFANRPAFGYAGRVFISTDTGAIYEDTGSAWTLIADAGAGTTGTLQQVTTNGNTTTLGVTIQGININDGAGTGLNNIVIGGGLQSNTTGTQNTAIGIDSLVINTTGFNNTALGGSTLNNNTTGNYNTAIGYSSLQANTTGASNVGIGNQSLLTNTTGGQNTAVGHFALYSNTTASFNTAIGYGTLNANTTGANNTAIGWTSLLYNTTGASNTAIGVESLKANTTGNNNVAIGNQSLNDNTTGLQNTAIGVGALNKNTTASNNTAIGFNSLVGNTTGAGNTAIGSSSLIANTTGNNNVAIGNTTFAANTTGIGNTAIGTSALNVNSTANYNTAIGFQSLVLNTTGTQNTAIGVTAGNLITTGSNNTIIGNYGGTSTLANHIVLSDGAGNVRLFSDANGLIGIGQAVGTPGGQLDIHTTQTYSLVLNGLTTNNAYTAFSNNSVGKWRIGNTYNAGANSFDIFNLGTSTTAITISSTNNVGIGTNLPGAILDINIPNVANTDLLRFSNSVGGSGDIAKFQYGASGEFILNLLTNASANRNFGILNGNVGIGTSTPMTFGGFRNLTIRSSSATNQAAIFLLNSTETIRGSWYSNGGTQVNFGTATNHPLVFDTNDTEKMRILSSGKILFGNGLTTDFGSGHLCNQVDQTAENGIALKNTSSANNGNFIVFINSANATAGTITQSGATTILFVATSDYRYKENILPIENAIDRLLKIKPVTYTWKNTNNEQGEGFIAHELQEIVPLAVSGIKDEKNIDGTIKAQGIDYGKLTPLLVKAIQELNEKLVRNNIN